MICRIALSLLLSLLCASATAGLKGNVECQRLIDEAYALNAEGKTQAAIEKLQAAQKADPTASLAVSALAQMLFHVAPAQPPEMADKLRATAEKEARRALTLDQADPIAQDVLRLMSDSRPLPLHHANAAASTP